MINKSLSIIIPIYNEKSLIRGFFKELKEFMTSNFLDYEIIIIESGSTDNSYKICKELAKNDHSIKLFREDKRNGFGSALKIGFKNASKEFVTMTTVDMPYKLIHIIKALNVIDEYDFVLSYRRIDNRILGRRIQSFVYNTLVNIFLNLGVKHVNSALKVYRKKVISQIKIYSNSWFIDVEIIYKLKKNSKRFCEIPIELIEDKKRTSTVTSTTFLSIFKELIIFWINTKKKN